MPSASVRSRRTNSFVVLVASCGGLILTRALYEVLKAPPGVEWLTLALLTLISGSFTVKVPSLSARFSVSEAFVITSGLLFGPAAGTLTVTLDALMMSFWVGSVSRSARRVAFNAAAPAIAYWLGSSLFFALAGVAPGQVQHHSLSTFVIPLFAFAATYFCINTGLIALAVASEKGLSPLSVWQKHFPAFAINYFGGSSVAALLVAFAPRIDLSVLSIVIPLLFVSYATFRSSIGRLEDATRHVSQMNEMYLATIEALALAVDAKDQITHGHIRRVQICTVELAKQLGVTDEGQLQAIEAAALLHDMGKLAVPEYILNKPGRLSPAEFDKMKTHAQIGADLLSSVKFPYPVVPIVRHHHENWDGSGYPAGLSGVDIPLGARLLSVVDCFDALTSDRPYRPRLANEAAFGILRERRGTFYDPVVVDTFIAKYDQIAAKVAQEDSEPHYELLGDFIDSASDTASLVTTSSPSSPPLELLEAHLQKVATAEAMPQALALATRCVTHLTPANVCAFFLFDPDQARLICTHSGGRQGELLLGLEIEIGERVSGWTAANEATSLNSHAALDLGSLAQAFAPALQSTLSVPVIKGGHLIGVLTGYSDKGQAFSQAQRELLEKVAATLAGASYCQRQAPLSSTQAAAKA
ncbi:MAG TPA: hypothetical protein DHW34_02165 [Actinobacteria bacterium]|nr:hypothetical protein [Actinomycetota bacterium]